MNSEKLAQDPLMIDMRKSIDHYDVSFLHLLAERVRVVGKIMHVKQKQKIELGQSEARKEDMKNLIEMSVQLKLEKTFFKKILDMVFQDAMEQFNSGKLVDSPEAMFEICNNLKIEDLRNNLLNLDKSLCLVLAERFRIVKRIGEYKNSLKIPPLDPVRWKQVLESKGKVAESLGISVSLIKDIYNSIHEVSLNIEHEIAESH
ncbi:chorismate mutase [bacterium]|nr:chorismate mutase [bacterium]